MGFDKRRYNEMVLSTLDLETLNATTEIMDITGYAKFAILIALDSGSFTTGVLTLQVSDDGVTFTDTSTTINAAGLTDNLSSSMRFARLRVSTANDATGTVSGKIMAKAG